MTGNGEKPIKLLVPRLPRAEDLMPYLQGIDERQWYSNFGPLNARLEESLFPNLPHPPTTVCNATIGLELALKALQLPQRSNVMVPSFTYPASVCAIINAGHVPVFCDVDPKTWCVSEYGSYDYAGKSIEAAMPVCSFGAGIPFLETVKNPRISIVVDAAAAFFNHRPNPEYLTVYSLHATKVPAAAEGAIVTGPKLLIDRVRALSRFGMTDSPGVMMEGGTNAKLSEYHAAVALAMMKEPLKRFWNLQAMYERAHYLESALQEVGVTTQQFKSGEEHLHTSTYEVLLPRGVDVKAVQEYMGLRGIETRRWYWPLCHLMPAFADFKRLNDLPVSVDLSSRILGLPYHLQLTEEDIRRVCNVLMGAIQTHRT